MRGRRDEPKAYKKNLIMVQLLGTVFPAVQRSFDLHQLNRKKTISIFFLATLRQLFVSHQGVFVPCDHLVTKGPLVHCCGATEGSEQQHNQDLKEIYKGRRILEFITFYHNALHLTRVHCATNNSNKNTGKFGG